MGTYCYFKIKDINYNEINLRNKLKDIDLHCSIFCDKKKEMTHFQEIDDVIELKTKITNLELWNFDKKMYLVAVLDESIYNFHSTLIEKYELNHSYLNYIPHITLSYDSNEKELNELKSSLLGKPITLNELQIKENNENWKRENYE